MGQDRNLIQIPCVAYRSYFKLFLNTIIYTMQQDWPEGHIRWHDTSGQRMITKYHLRTLLCLVIKYSTIMGFMFKENRMWNLQPRRNERAGSGIIMWGS